MGDMNIFGILTMILWSGKCSCNGMSVMGGGLEKCPRKIGAYLREPDLESV